MMLFVNLSLYTNSLFFGWAAIGALVYVLYGYRRSELAPGSAAPQGGSRRAAGTGTVVPLRRASLTKGSRMHRKNGAEFRAVFRLPMPQCETRCT